MRSSYQPFEALESRALLGADLALTLGSITITDPGVPAEIIHVSTNITNSGDAQYASGGGIHYFLSTDLSLSPDDFSWETRPLGVFNPGDSSTFSFDAARPTASATLPAGTYHVIATLEFPVGVHDDFAGNNTAQTAETLTINGTQPPPPPPPVTEQFGTVNGAQTVLHETVNGQHTTFSIEGRGTGTLTVNNGVYTVTLDGTNSRTNLNIKADGKNDHPILSGITINGDAQRIRLAGVNITGNITVNGKLQELNAGDISGGTILITSAGRFTDIRVHDLTDVTINSAATIKTFQLHNWNLGDAAVRDALIAPTVEHIDDHGDFGADLAISGLPRRDSLKNVDIRGDITGGTWLITGNAGDIDVHNIASSWSTNITGDLKSLRVRGNASGILAAHNIKTLDFKHNVSGMMVLAGANLGSDAHLAGVDTASDTFRGGTIKDLKVGGNVTNSTFAAGVNPSNGLFGDSDDVYLSPSVINHKLVRGTVTNSFFLATTINGRRAHQNNDNHGGNSQGENHGNSGSDHGNAVNSSSRTPVPIRRPATRVSAAVGSAMLRLLSHSR